LSLASTLAGFLAGLTEGINEGVELMLTCKSYYGIRWSSEDDVDAQYQSVIRKIKDRL
jgi:hypothetical protein